MGETADRKVIEIGQTRERLEQDLVELEERLPAPLRSTKSLLGIFIGTITSAVVAKRLLSRRDDPTKQEVVIRVVREDRTGTTKDGSRNRKRKN
jgi:hypothetical protein